MKKRFYITLEVEAEFSETVNHRVGCEAVEMAFTTLVDAEVSGRAIGVNGLTVKLSDFVGVEVDEKG